MELLGAKLIGAGSATIALGGAAFGIGNVIGTIGYAVTLLVHVRPLGAKHSANEGLSLKV